MDEYEFARRASALLERFADRLSERSLRAVSSLRDVGEWDEQIDNLIAALAASRASVTREEQQELRTLLEELEVAAEPVDALHVIG